MSEEKKLLDLEVILIRERLFDSIAKDVVSIGTLTAGIYVGVLMNSSAMQWVTALLWMLLVFGRAIKSGKNNRLTIPEARKRLDEIEAAK